MAKYRIIATEQVIVADAAHMRDNFAVEEYELVAPTDAELAMAARAWRDQELKDTDDIARTPDRPDLAAYNAYRTELRDWPEDPSFPDTKPTQP